MYINIDLCDFSLRRIETIYAWDCPSNGPLPQILVILILWDLMWMPCPPILSHLGRVRCC